MGWPVGAAPLLQRTLSPRCCSRSLQLSAHRVPSSAVSVLSLELAALSTLKLCCSKPAALKLLVPSYQACYYFFAVYFLFCEFRFMFVSLMIATFP